MSTKVLAALLFAAASLVSLPAVASDSGDSRRTIFDRDETAIIIALHERGINATSVEEWGSVVRAFVEDEQGRTTFQFFQPGRLEVVKFN